MINEKVILKMAEAFNKLKIMKLKGFFSGNVLLTPSSVERVLGGSEQYQKPGFLIPRCEFKISPLLGKVKLNELLSGKQLLYSGDINIFSSGIIFPDFCCDCIKPATKYELIELGIATKNFNIEIPKDDDMTQEAVNQIAQAIGMDRYWYAIPFCNTHSLYSESVGFDTWTGTYEQGGTHFILQFTNREYGKLFSDANKIEGKWLSRSSLLRKIISTIGIVIGSFITFFGGLFTYFGLKEAKFDKISFLFAYIPFIIGLGLLGWCIYLRIKAVKGEKI